MKNALNHYKNNDGRNFNVKNSHLLILSLPTEEIFYGHGVGNTDFSMF